MNEIKAKRPIGLQFLGLPTVGIRLSVSARPDPHVGIPSVGFASVELPSVNLASGGPPSIGLSSIVFRPSTYVRQPCVQRLSVRWLRPSASSRLPSDGFR